MSKRKRQKRSFSGMGYRDVQQSNASRRRLLPQADQAWLKTNGYRNVGWDNVISLYQKINDLLDSSNADEPPLEELFLEADRIGQKYQTPEEINTFNQQLASEVQSLSDLIDQQFPDPEVEAINYAQKPPSRPPKRSSRKKS